MQIPGTYRPREQPSWAKDGAGGKLAKVYRARRVLVPEGKLNNLLRDLLSSPDDLMSMGRWSYCDATPTVLRYPGDPNAGIHIGAFCSIAKDTTFVLSGNHDPRRVTTSPVRLLLGVEGYDTSGEVSGRGNITIGNDVWVGRGAMFLSGARVGDGAVIGARAVVSGTVEPYAIAVGNPAVTVRKRFDDDTITRLVASQWWTLPDDYLRSTIDLLSSHDITAFLDHLDANPPR